APVPSTPMRWMANKEDTTWLWREWHAVAFPEENPNSVPTRAVNLYIITSSPAIRVKRHRCRPVREHPQDSDLFREDIDHFVKIAFPFDRLIDRLVVEAVVAVSEDA